LLDPSNLQASFQACRGPGRLAGAQVARTLGSLLATDATKIQAENYAADDATLEVCARSVDLVVRHAHEAQLDRQVPHAIAALFNRARAAGLGHEGPAALVKLLRGSAAP
jgi:3-hydroxyisobutyrate dehydrogenase-like beta-hydroxyacid dehydrogenase